MSINLVFGSNLRLLSLARGTFTKAATDLEISRIRFQRYLLGESFPKPNELDRICRYFGVDARILTQPLNDNFPQEWHDGAAAQRTISPLQEKWLTAIGHAAPTHDYFAGPHLLDDGLYTVWRKSMIEPEKVFRSLLQVKTVNDVKLVRGYTAPSLFPEGKAPSSQRVFRGFAMRLMLGYSILLFDSEPSLITSTIYISPRPAHGSNFSFLGFCSLSRDESQGQRRTARILMEKAPNGCRQLIQEAHKPPLYAQDDVPVRIMKLLEAPLD